MNPPLAIPPTSTAPPSPFSNPVVLGVVGIMGLGVYLLATGESSTKILGAGLIVGPVLLARQLVASI
jgi:hypothetical protein